MTNSKRSKYRRRRKRREARSKVSKDRGSENLQESATILTTREESAQPDTMTKRLDCTVAKVDESLGLVFGWAIVCTEDGDPYVDTQGDYIPDRAMLKAATKFAKGARQGGDMHSCDDGVIVHQFPLTAEVAKAFGIKCDKTGLMIAMEPFDHTLAKFKNGERTGFSIGGRRITDTPMELS